MTVPKTEDRMGIILEGLGTVAAARGHIIEFPKDPHTLMGFLALSLGDYEFNDVVPAVQGAYLQAVRADSSFVEDALLCKAMNAAVNIIPLPESGEDEECWHYWPKWEEVLQKAGGGKRH